MALTRVQATGKVFNVGSALSLAVPLATPPTLGNALIVPVSMSGSSTQPPNSCLDNYGNFYERIALKATGGGYYAAVFACYAVAATGASFTVTVSSGYAFSQYVASVVEVGGGVGGLFVDRVVTNNATSAAPTTGVTAALRSTSGNAFAVSVHTIQATQASITVESVAPAWTQEYEHLTSAQVPTEADTRVLTGVTGTTQSCTWADATSNSWAAILVIFASASDLPPIEARETQAIVETLTHPTTISARVTQAIVETLTHPTPAARVTQIVVETLTWSTVLAGGVVAQTVPSTAVLFAPALVARDQAVTSATRATAAALFTPTVSAVAAKAVTGVNRPSTAALFAPQVRADLAVTTATRASAVVLFAPSVVAAVVDHGPTACATAFQDVLPTPPTASVIPAGTIMVGGYGYQPYCMYLSPDGTTIYPQPATAPNPGEDLEGMVRLSTGDVAQMGGEGPDFYPAGAGVFNGSDLAALSQLTTVDRQDGFNCAADDQGFWYTVVIGPPYAPVPPEGNGFLLVSRLDRLSQTVATWDIPIPGYSCVERTFGLAVSGDGQRLYHWLYAMGQEPHAYEKATLLVFSLAGAGSMLGPLTTDFQYFPYMGSLYCVPGTADVIVAFDHLNSGRHDETLNPGAIRRYSASGALMWTAGVPAGAGDIAWEGIAPGLPGDTHFLAWAYDSNSPPGRGCRYCWFDYATGTPDESRNFFTPDDGTTFSYDSQFVILAHDVAVGPPIPAGTIMIGGWGNTPPYRFLSPDGSTSYPPPPSLPGASCAAFARLPNGDIALGGGGDATFPSGGGVYKASDLTVRSAYDGDGDGGRCVAVDALGFYYLHTYVYLTNQVQITRLNGATSEVVQVWLSDPFGDFTSEDGATTTWGLHSSSLAISPDGRTAYCDLLGPVRHPTQHHHRIHVFDLSGSTAVWLGLLNADDYCYYGFGDGFMACLDNGDVLVAYGDYEQGSTIFNKGTVVRYTPAGAIVWVAGDPAGTAGVDDLEWDGLALGVPGDTHFLAYMWEFEAARPTQQMRYCWFSYATGAPDNTRNFTLPFDQDEPSGFEYNSQFVILAHAIGGDGGTGGGTPILVCADGGFPIDDEGPPAPIVTPPTVIPAGTIMVFGYGDADLLRYLSPDGSISYEQPASTPTPGAGLSACCRLSTGDVAVVGGGGTGTSGVDFPTSGAGVYQASDLSKRSEVADVHIQDGDSITSDALGYWYLIHSTVAPDPGTATHILISRLNATSQVVATWDIPLPSPYNGYVDFPGAQHIAVSEDGQTFYAMLHKLVPMSGFTLNQFIVHKFSLAGAGACLGPLMGDWDGHPSYQPMFIVPDGSGDLIVSFNRLNSTITGGETGALRRYTSSGALVWTAATPAGPGPFYWEAIALGVPGDPHFLAYAYSDDTNSSSCRYVWFDYATGTPDNARSFAPDDGAGFEFDSQFVILAHAVPL